MSDNDKSIIIASDINSLIYQGPCIDCGHEIVASKDDTFCPMCGSMTAGKPKTSKITVKASVAKLLKPTLFCSTCNSTINTNNVSASTRLAATIYCPVCGSADVEVANEEVNEEEFDDEADDLEDDTEGEVEDKLSDISVDDENMEASFLNKPESHWVIFNNGVPLVRIRKSTQPPESHTIFASEKFFDIFRQRVKETTLFAAVKEFGAEIINSEEVMQPEDVEEVAYDRLQSSVLPKFLDCVTMSIEGMVRNIYPSLNKELKASFYDELRARGIKEPEGIVDASFDSAGSKVFAALIAKAMELYNKPEEIRAEIKDTILSTDKAKDEINSVPVTEDDLESLEVRAKLTAGNIPVKESNESITYLSNNSFIGASVDNMRDRINLGRR